MLPCVMHSSTFKEIQKLVIRPSVRPSNPYTMLMFLIQNQKEPELYSPAEEEEEEEKEEKEEKKGPPENEKEPP